MTELSPQEVVRQSVANMALHALKSKRADIDRIVANIASCDKAINGLPGLSATCREAVTQFKAAKEEAETAFEPLIQAAKTDDERAQIETMKSLSIGVSSMGYMFGQIMVAGIQTQLGVAKILKHQASLMLIYVSGTGYDADCVAVASKAGEGKAALEQMWQNKVAPGVVANTEGANKVQSGIPVIDMPGDGPIVDSGDGPKFDPMNPASRAPSEFGFDEGAS